MKLIGGMSARGEDPFVHDVFALLLDIQAFSVKVELKAFILALKTTKVSDENKKVGLQDDENWR